jgi:hypothetical protein
MEGGRLQDEENVMEVNAIVAALAGISASAQEFSHVKAESAAKAAREGDFGLSVADILAVMVFSIIVQGLTIQRIVSSERLARLLR